jgi:fatty acid/phospholipid biosynthesis enzyme
MFARVIELSRTYRTSVILFVYELVEHIGYIESKVVFEMVFDVVVWISFDGTFTRFRVA